MNDNIWELLQIEPTTDQALIKKAYARQSKVFHPEEDPEGFLRLREAYSRALQWAEEDGGWSSLDEAPAPEQDRREEEPQQEEGGLPLFVFRQTPEGPNPFRESGGYRSFLAAYRKENQKNWKLWMEFVTSPEFLADAWEEEFCALIRDTVREKEPEFKPGQEFIKSLYIAYCFSATDIVIDSFYTGDETQAVTERRFRQEQGRQTVPEPVFDIARQYPIPKRMTGNDNAMKAAFNNYYYLRSLDEETGWSEQGQQGLQKVLGQYVLTYIRDNYTGDEPMECVRHPLGIRLLNDFFATARLSAECCRMAWETLELKQAVMGRNKLLYGRLREICLEKYPGLGLEETESFAGLNRVCDAYFQGSYVRDEADIRQEERETEAFLGREDVRRALRNRRYVESNVLKFWLNDRRSLVFLSRLRALYEKEPELPCAGQVLQGIAKAQESRRISRQNAEDTPAPIEIDLNYRPFLRYFLNTAFRDFRELRQYLQEQLPYLPEWAGRLPASREEPVSRRVMLDGMEIELRMHLYYVEYRVDGQEVCKPFLSCERVEALETEEMLYLLPMVASEGDGELGACAPDGMKLAERLQKRLEATALPPENRRRVAELIAEKLKRRFYAIKRFQEEDGAALPLRIYRESGDTLYCAEWRQDEGMMGLYVEQGQESPELHSLESYDFIEDETEAAVLGRELLERMIAPPPIDCSCMEIYPETVYASSPASPECVLSEEDIAEEVLNELLERFAEGELERLEFSFKPCPWELKAEDVESYPRKRALVFIRQEQGVSCFYFDDTQYIFYALMKRSGGDSGLKNYVSLSHKRLPPQCVFGSFDPVRSNLENILSWASRAETSLDKRTAAQLDNCVWKAAWGGVYIQSRREKYNLAKQELGGFPLERAWNAVGQPVRLDQSPEELNKRPVELERRTRDGAADTIQVNGIKRAQFSEAVQRFFRGDIVWLRLSWDVLPDGYRKHFAPQFFEGILARRMGKPMRSHIILRREDERYTLLCLQDMAERAQYHVADRGVYMDVEGKKYPKESFMGRSMPAYLIHRDPVVLRNLLDLLLDNMECLLPVTERFAEFASENPVKARDYNEIRREFVAEIQDAEAT